jgi:hypothetical protein
MAQTDKTVGMPQSVGSKKNLLRKTPTQQSEKSRTPDEELSELDE